MEFCQSVRHTVALDALSTWWEWASAPHCKIQLSGNNKKKEKKNKKSLVLLRQGHRVPVCFSSRTFKSFQKLKSSSLAMVKITVFNNNNVFHNHFNFMRQMLIQSNLKFFKKNWIQYLWHLHTEHLSHQTNSNISNVFGEALLLSKCLNVVYLEYFLI